MYHEIILDELNEYIWRYGMEHPEEIVKMRCLGVHNQPLTFPKDIVFEVILRGDIVHHWDDFSRHYGRWLASDFAPAPDDAEVLIPWDYRRHMDDWECLPPMEYKPEQSQEEIRIEIQEKYRTHEYR